MNIQESLNDFENNDEDDGGAQYDGEQKENDTGGGLGNPNFEQDKLGDFNGPSKPNPNFDGGFGERYLRTLIQNLHYQCMNSFPFQNQELVSDEEDSLLAAMTNNNIYINNNSNCNNNNLTDASPLQLPFSTVGVSGARLTRLFAELRERTNLDLFQVPTLNAADPTTSSNVQSSSLFDADALAEELERHERTLKEFDDFISDFQNIELFNLVPSPIKDIRQ